jgi:hypothetical protein
MSVDLLSALLLLAGHSESVKGPLTDPFDVQKSESY